MEENSHRFYVYTYEDDRGVYYVGKGTGSRACSHAIDKRRVVTITVVAEELTEEQALDIEAWLINHLPNLENTVQPVRFRPPVQPFFVKVPVSPLREHLTTLIARGIPINKSQVAREFSTSRSQVSRMARRLNSQRTTVVPEEAEND